MGGAFLDNVDSKDGFAVIAGVGVDYSLAKNVSAVADWRYQRGQQRVEQFNGSTVGAGVKVTF